MLIDSDDQPYFKLGKLLGASAVLGVTFWIAGLLALKMLFWLSFIFLALTVIYYGAKFLYDYLSYQPKNRFYIG